MKKLGCCEPCWREGIQATAVTQVDTTPLCGWCVVFTLIIPTVPIPTRRTT